MAARAFPTKLAGVIRIEPDVRGDDRGFFVETFSHDEWRELGVDVEFLQQNHSRSKRHTLRGLHFQTVPGQAKLVRCARGEILDVAVDLRKDSPTYGQWDSCVLDDVKHHQLFVPVGFAHGFAVLSEEADVCYQVSSLYADKYEKGIAWDDPEIGVDWGVTDPILSDRDKEAPRLAEIADSLPW